MIDRKAFFAGVRTKFRALTQPQVDGFTSIIDEWERRDLSDLRWLAYMLATVWHETAQTMQPIAEYGLGKGRAYGKPDPTTGKTYYGRGYVQLTWKENYVLLGKRIGVDLVNHPDLAMESKNAAAILFEGMISGLFTGKSLKAYFSGSSADWVGARRIINGTDKAETIANYGRKFYAILQSAYKPAPSLPPATGTPLKPAGGSSGGAGASVPWDGPAAPAPSPVAQQAAPPVSITPLPAPAAPAPSVTPPLRPVPAPPPPPGLWARFVAALAALFRKAP